MPSRGGRGEGIYAAAPELAQNLGQIAKSRQKFKYRTRAIITRGLYIFYPIFYCGL